MSEPARTMPVPFERCMNCTARIDREDPSAALLFCRKCIARFRAGVDDLIANRSPHRAATTRRQR